MLAIGCHAEVAGLGGEGQMSGDGEVSFLSKCTLSSDDHRHDRYSPTFSTYLIDVLDKDRPTLR
jgi:hypothetical protein